ncbi:MAG: aminoacyl-tRNA hydrolase [Gemmatimonadetes bacterium]|nr:aminoacyl-tRNA hydrolase [Gemmatimonadota bacterium]
MKVVVGLGNPGLEYDDTRHNVGWWVVDRLCRDWRLGPFRRQGPALVVDGVADGARVRVIKPLTYMNQSGVALAPLISEPAFEPSRDLLVVVDDAALETGRLRFRAQGSAGGHRGLESVERALGTQAYPRLRVGVGPKPPGVELADWVLSPMPAEDEEVVVALLPELIEAIGLWVREGIERAMSRYNR